LLLQLIYIQGVLKQRTSC